VDCSRVSLVGYFGRSFAKLYMYLRNLTLGKNAVNLVSRGSVPLVSTQDGSSAVPLIFDNFGYGHYLIHPRGNRVCNSMWLYRLHTSVLESNTYNQFVLCFK
jgi:hypothetical protein